MSINKSCPMRLPNLGNCDCECAWWNEHSERCAILDIAMAMRGATAAVTALDHYGKDL